MLAAVSEARQRWPEFVKAFEERSRGQLFSVKGRLTEGSTVEYMWISVTAIEGSFIYGRLDNQPVTLRRLKLGSRLRLPLSDLNDWTFLQGKDVRGGFTIEVLRDNQDDLS
jgi:uncharacterized protein YegJ (DUF2314 family)